MTTNDIEQGVKNLKQGGKTEAAILSKLVEMEYSVLIPWDHFSRFDFAAYKDGQFIRIQCKTASIKNDIVSFQSYSTIKRNGKWIREDYKNDIDWFLAYCSDNKKIYCVKPSETSKRRFKLYLNPKSKQARKAIDYEFK